MTNSTVSPAVNQLIVLSTMHLRPQPPPVPRRPGGRPPKWDDAARWCIGYKRFEHAATISSAIEACKTYSGYPADAIPGWSTLKKRAQVLTGVVWSKIPDM